MDPSGAALQAESAELLNRLRNVVADGPAEYLGRLDEREPLAIVEAYLYLRQVRLEIPDALYRSLQRHVLEVLGVPNPLSPAEHG